MFLHVSVYTEYMTSWNVAALCSVAMELKAHLSVRPGLKWLHTLKRISSRYKNVTTFLLLLLLFECMQR